jgi:hypothetical protein
MPAFSGKSENGLTLRRLARLRLVSLLAIEQMLFLPFMTLDVRAQPITTNQIVTDGRTATAVTTSGNVTSVTTSTVSGANAFNSFSQFGVGQGNTVNLYTPNGAQNLINIVRDAPAYVNGTLNSYANGKIGGNVYFADPYGFVVGKSGTVNVGSLNISTPSKGFTDSIIGANGAINGGAVSNLMSGSFPISPDGNIRILGRINAEDGVRLTGQNVVIGGAGMNQRERVNADHAVKFAASVNSKGLRSASAINVRNGSIHIGAVNNATISGRLSARSRTTTPSTITVDAGKNITLGKTASLTTSSKTGDAGNITLKTQGDLTVKSGAKIDASSAKGNGGTVDLSADGKFDIGDKVQINLAAPNGKQGNLVLDPVDIIVGDNSDANATMTNATVAAAIAALNGTGTFTLSASNSITIDATGRVDGGTGVSVTLSAPTLTLMAGSYLRGDTVTLDSGIAGTININAASNGGAQVLANTALQFTGTHLVLTSTASAIVGDGTSDTSTNRNAAGFISNAAIARYAAAMSGLGDLTVSAATAITVDATGVIDTRQLGSNGASTGKALDVTLTAPTITIASGGKVLAQSNNTADLIFASGNITLDATGSAPGAVTVAGLLSGNDITLKASSVALNSSAVVDSRNRDVDGNALSNSGDVSVTANSITASAGSQIVAGTTNTGDNTFVAGSITFDASGASNGTVVANGSLTGSNVSLMAGASVSIGAVAQINASVPGGTASITLQAPAVTVTSGAQFSADAVVYNFQRSAVIVGNASDTNASAAGFLSNDTVAGYLTAQGNHGTLTLSAIDALTVDALGVIAGGTAGVSLKSTAITLAGNSSVTGSSVAINGDTVNINAGVTGAAQISPSFQLVAGTLNLSSSADMVVGDAANPLVNLTNATIAGYLSAGGPSIGTLQLSASSSITIKNTGVIDVRRIDTATGYTSAASSNIALSAAAITIESGASLRADVHNIPAPDPNITTPQRAQTFYSAGTITLTSPNITVAANTLNGGVVTFNAGQGTIYVGPSNDPNGVSPAAGTVFLSNATIASYLASLAGSSTFVLSATNSIYVDNGASIAAGTTRNVNLTAGSLLSFAGNSVLTGNLIKLNAGRTGTLAVNAAKNGGATITAQSPLVLTAGQVTLTSTANVNVGASATDANSSAAGFIDNAAIARYVTALHGGGKVTISASNSVTVDASGRIDGTLKDTNGHSTANGVNLTLSAAAVTVAAGAQIDAQAVNVTGAHATNFTSSTVTLNGTNLITIGGTVQASTILLSSAGIDVANTASLAADAAGSVRFAFSTNESVDNSSGHNGTGGTLSNSAIANYIAAMSGGTFVLSTPTGLLALTATAVIDGGTTVNVALSARTLTVADGAHIQASTVGIGSDQDNVIVGPTGDSNSGNAGFVSNATIANLILAAASSTTFTISANNSIIIDAGGIIDTRFLNASNVSQKNALGVTLNAPTISIMQGAEIRAQAVNTTGAGATHYTDGTVRLTANASQTLLSGLASATTGITVDGKISGGLIVISATSTATSNLMSSIAGDLATIAEVVGTTLYGLNGGYVAASTVAKVAINGHADISGTGNVLISAKGSQDAEDPVVSIGFVSPLGAAVVVGNVTSDVSTIVASGASVHAGSGLYFLASNNTTLDISALSVTTAGSFLATVAVGTADIKTEATVNTGANISSGNAPGVQVTANNTGSYSVSSTGMAFTTITSGSDNGGVGAAVAMSNIKTSAKATLGANIGTSASAAPGGVVVAASNDITKNATSASVTLGTPGLLGLILTEGLGKKSVGDVVAYFLKPLFDPIKLPLKTAGALSLATTSATANAGIASTNGGAAPAIYVAGDVAVFSNLIDDQIRNNSSSTVTVSNSSDGPAIAIAAAVAYGTFEHNSNAYVGANVVISASDIGVSATTTVPNTNTWDQWNSVSEVFSHLNGNFGVVNNIVTSYANANASGGTRASIAGSFAYFGLTDNTTAWVGSNASLTSTHALSTAGPWTAEAIYADNSVFSQGFSSALTVAALALNNSIDIGGVFGPLVLLPGSDSPGSAAGGTLNLINSASNTIAGVSTGASLSSLSDVSVTASTTDMMFAIAPTSGSSSGSIALNGILSLAFVSNTTHASISSGASVTAPRSLTIFASQNLSLFSLSGAIQLETTSGVGVSVAYMTAATDTAAYIGDNHTDITGGAFSGDDANATSGTGGHIRSRNVVVDATTAGRVTVASVAAVESDPLAKQGYVAKAKTLYQASSGGGFEALLEKAKQAAQSSSGTSSYSIDIAGSSAASNTSLDTTAYIKGVTVNSGNPYLAADAPAIQVQALNDTIITNGSGSAALNLADGKDSNAAIGGAITVALSSNTTKAYISNSTITDENAVTVQALSGGSLTAVAIALAITRAGNAASVSVSVGSISDSATAYIDGSTITGVTGGTTNTANIDAYQTSNIAIGGGSLYLNGGKNGAGVAITYAEIRNPGGGNAVDAHISNSIVTGLNSLTVLGDDSSVIAAGGASGGYAENGLAGAVVIAQISPTVLAYISSSTITVSGNVTVTADSVDVGSLDNTLGTLVRTTNRGQLAQENCTVSHSSQTCVDFSGAALNGGVGAGPGAAITSVAGIIQVGKANVGVSVVYDSISTTHSAYITRTLMTVTTGDVLVAAEDSSKIQSVALGVGISTGKGAGQGGAVISTIKNNVTAAIGDGTATNTDTVVNGRNVSVQALDTSSISAAAALAGVSSEGNTAGLAIVYSEIDNQLNASVSGAKIVATGDVKVSASSTGSISAVAVGVAVGGGNFSLAGSLATSVLGTNVSAYITGGADVMATNNVGVIASNSDTAAVFAGAFSITKGSAGGAGSLVTSNITGSTSAYISGAGTKVDALGTSSSDTLSVNSGTLAHPLNLGNFNAPTDNTPDLSETQEAVRGLAVVASSHQAIVTNVASLAASSGVSIMVNAIINVMSGSTNAYIDGASIDTRLTSATLAPKIDVAASSFSYGGTFGLGIVAPTGTAGGGATIISTTMSRATFADVINSTVGGVVGSSPTVGAVTVKANAEQDASSVAVGFGSASVGLNVFIATTEAYVDGGSLTGTSLSVIAKDSTGIASANGSGAYGGTAAIGAAFLVQVSANRTEAYVGDEFHYQGNGAANTTTVSLTGALDVEATTIDRFQAYSVGAALATGSLAGAGMANVEIANNTTIAGIYDTTVASPTGGAAGAITVNATEDVAIKEIAGALAIATGGVGVGAAANVLVFKSQTTAETRNSDMNSSGVVDVEASSTKEVLSYAVTAGIGSSVGIGAAVGVIIVGNNTADSDTQGQETGQLHGTLGSVNQGTNTNHGAGVVGSGQAGNPGNAGASSTYDVSTVLTGGNDGVTAQIAGGHVTATEVDVGATSANATQMFLLGAGFGKDVGVGAGIGYTNVSSSVLANLNAIVVAPSVSVMAAVQDATTGPYAGKTIDSQAVAGGLALYFGADAAVAVGNVTNTVTAELGGSVTGSGGAGVVVGALDSSTQSVSAGGGSGGIAAIGASVAITGKSSTVTAKLLSGTSGANGTTINASTLQVGAAEAGALSASSVAVGGGIASGQASAATAKEHSTVLAQIGDYASITTSASGVGTLVSASSTPNVSADAKGFIVAAGALGLSIAIGDASVTVTADVGDNSTFTGGALAVTAMQLVPAGGYNVQATAIAAVGAALIGLQGSYAGASDSSTVKAYGGTGITLPGGDVVISAENDSRQYSKASGIAAGYIGVGATVAQSTSNADTEAWLDTGAVTAASRLGILQIGASGTDSNTAFAQAGSGGVIAGAAAAGLTQANATTLATLKGNTTIDTLYTGGLNVQAKHVTNYNGTGDAFQASVAGASGGNSTNKVTSTTAAEIGTNLIVNSAGGDMLVISNDVVNQTGGGARAGSGGVFVGAATVSNSTITQTVDTKIDSGTILSLNDDPDGSTAKLRVEAFNTVNTADSVNMTTGGLFAGGGAASNLTATATVTVTIDATELFSAGALYVGTASTMASSNNANANLYGVITGAGASSDSSLTATQAVNVSGNSTIEAWGAIGIYAGQAGDGSVFSNLAASATTIVYNYALVPATGVFRGTASAKDDATLTLASGSQVLGATNVSLGATRGFVSAAGTGTNYNPYLSAFSTANHDNHSHPDGSAAAHLNGVIAAGIYNNETITIALGATAPVLTTTSPYALAMELVADPSHLNPVVSYNHQKIQYTVLLSFNPFQEIVSQLSTLSGQTAAAVTAALAVTNPTITVATGTDPTGDKQRQVDTLIKQAAFAANASGAAIELGNIVVSGGNVSILAETIDGTQAAGKPAPSVTAMNTAAINIENRGLNFLALSNLTAGSISGGHVTFGGTANDTSSPGVTYHQDLAGTAPVISVFATYNVIDPNSGLGVDQAGVALTKTPDIYFNGVVSNVNGLFDISAALGNVVASQSFNAATIQLVAPHGTFTYNGGVGSIFSSNNDVASQWQGTEYRPTDTLTAVEAAATYLGAYGWGGSGGAVIGGNYNYHPYDSYYDYKAGNPIVSDSVTRYSNSSQIFTARLLNLADAGGKTVYSAIFLPTGYTNNNDSLGRGGIATNNVTALAQAEGTTTDKISTSYWETNDFKGQAYSGSDSGPFNCNSCGTFFQVVNIQNAVITPKTASQVATVTDTKVVHADKALLLSASVLNINGTISSGSSSNYSVNLDSSLLTTINSLKAGTLANVSTSSVTAQAQQGKFFDLSPYLSTLNTGDTKVGARYDILTNQIVLNSVVQGSGGYVYLNGKIISTSTDGTMQGNIIVNGGAGTITVNNSTGLGLVTNTINTGVSAASVVEIVDQLKQQTTWYVYNAAGPAGQQVAKYVANNTSTSGYTASMLQGNYGPSGLTYSPSANQYLQWVESATLTRPDTANPAAYGWTFNNPNNPWGDPTQSLVANVKTVANGVATTTNQTTNFQEVVTATGTAHSYNVSTGSKCCGTDISGGTWVQEIYNSLTLTLTNTVKASNDIGIQFNGGGTSSVNVTSNASIVINGSINNLQGITTVQTNTANASITLGATANNPLISGTSVFLIAPGGIGSIAGVAKKPIPVQVYGGALTALSQGTDIAIAAQGALRINQVNTNGINTQPTVQGNVYLSATGDINSSGASNVNAPVVIGNSIEINSTGGAIGAISSLSGGVSVLTNLNPLVIEATGTTQPDGSVIGGVVNSASSTGTYLVQSTGDLRLGTVSSNGPVFLAAAASDGLTANIVNGLSNGGLTATQAAHLQTVWNDLSLLSGSASVAVNSYQAMVNAAYTDYWQLRNLAFTNGSTYSLTSLGNTVLTAQVVAKYNLDVAHTDPTVLQQMVQTEATQRFERAQYLLGIKTAAQLADSLTTLFGANLAGNAYLQAAPTTAALTTALTAYDKHFSYVLSTGATLYSQITSGSQWTHDQLSYTVSADANPANNVLPPSISDISVGINVSGRDVMLYAPNGAIGKLAAPDPFSFTSVDSSHLSGTQKGLLASSGPGQLTVTSTTDAVTGVVTYTVNVKQENLVILNPLASVAANARDDVYLGSKTDLVLGGNADALLSAMTGTSISGVRTVGGGSVKLDAVGNILASVAGQTVISGDIKRLTLIAETGSIGHAPAAGTDPFTNPNALRISLSNPTVDRLDQAIGGQGIYLKQTSGDLILGNVTSSGAIQFAATGSIYEEPQFTLQSVVHIAGASLDLRAGGDIGFNDTTAQPLQVQISGAVTGSAVGNVSILSPASDLNVGASGAFGGLTAGGTLTLNAAVTASLAFTKLNINGDITSDGAMLLLAKGAVTFGAGSSSNPIVANSANGAVTLSAASLSMGAYSAIDAAGVITIATVGDATLGQVKSTASYVAAGNAASIVVSAGGVTSGAILGNGDGQTNFIASGTGAQVALSASSIGTASQRLSLNAPFLTATASTGGIYLSALANLEATSLSAVKSSVDIRGSGDLTLDSVLAGTGTGGSGVFKAATNGGSITIGTAASSGSQTIQASQNVTFNALVATGVTGDAGDINVTATNGFILAQTVAPGGGTTLGSVAANGSVTLAAGTTITGNTLTAVTGAGSLTASGLVTWNTLNVATTLGATSNQDSIVFKTATSGNSQLLQAHDNVTFNALAATGIAGDITVNASNGFILAQTVTAGGVTTQGSVAANHSASLTAGNTITGNTLSSTTGAGSLTAQGLITWNALNVATTLGATSNQDSIVFKTATSGNALTLQAHDNVTFNALAATGIAGDITVNASNGFILAQTVTAGGVTTQGSVAANRAASLTAGSTITGNTLSATTGAGSLTAQGLITWNALNVATTLGATSNQDSIVFKTATSGNALTLQAHDNVTFNALTATGIAGDITVNASNGFILAQTVTAGGVTTQGSVAANRTASLTAGSTITGNTLTATTGAGSLTAQGLITWNTLNTGTTLGATSNQDSIVFKTATSGNALTLQAHDNVTFNALTATGVTGDITVNASNGFILAQTVTTGGVTTQGSVAANRTASLTAGNTITGNTLSSTTGAGSLTAQGLITWNTLNVATTLGATSNQDSIVFKTATSGGAQLLQAHDNITFNALTATGITGDITVNASNGFILAQTVTTGGVTTQGSVSANRTATLTAGTTITGNTLAATTGAGSLTALGLVNWNTLNVATALGVTSTGSSIALGSAHSGGSQTLQARQNVAFNQLTTDGTVSDAGNVGINATTGALTGGSINAHGSANLIAATANTGHNLTTVTGAASLQGQVIQWDNLTIAGALGITATAGGITLGTAISGGTQTLHAVDDIAFSQLTTNGIAGDAGDVNLRSDHGSILGGSVFANGDVHLNTGKSLALDALRGNSIGLSAPGDITIKSVSVVKELDLAANTINVTGRQIRSNPSIPLVMNVTGYNGGIATSANLVIDPDAIIVNQFRVVDANFVTDAPQVTIVNGLVPGQLMLTTLTERILLDNRSPAPSNWATLQLYQPGGAFTMIQNLNANFTDSFVVFYTGDISSTVSTYSASHACCNIFSGSMAIRNIANDTDGTETINSWLAQKTGAETFYLLGIAGDERLRALQSPKPVETIGSGPAVNIEGLTELRKLRQLQREGQKAGKPGWRSTGLDDNARRSVERFASAQ